MKIYYAASIFGAAGDANFNFEVIRHLKNYGIVLSELLFAPDYKSNEKLDAVGIHDRDLNWVGEADRIVADVSAPSLGVGYELAHAKFLNKPTLCLWRVQEGKKLSAMIDGSPRLSVVRFSETHEALRAIDYFFRR